MLKTPASKERQRYKAPPEPPPDKKKRPKQSPEEHSHLVIGIERNSLPWWLLEWLALAGRSSL